MARVQPKRRLRASSDHAVHSPPANHAPLSNHAPLTRHALLTINAGVVACDRCPRLRRYCAAVARTKRRAYMDQEYWGHPVPGFGDPRARVWLVGLAPAAHGANRTGRMFTGDSSGEWLFRALHGAGFARLPHSVGRDDGQALRDVYVSAAARCAPPDNKPLPAELARCRSFLEAELQALSRLRVVVPLGKIAFDAVLRLLEDGGFAVPRPRPRFGHGASCRIGFPGREAGPGKLATRAVRRELLLLASYHPSRQNTQTGKLTREMLDGIFTRARESLAER